MQWEQHWKNFVLAGLLITGHPGFAQAQDKVKPQLDPETAALSQALEQTFDPHGLHAQAVLILPIYDPDTAQVVTNAKAANYAMQRAFEQQGIPCFMAGDTANGVASLAGLERDIDSFQHIHHCQSLTIINCAHNGLFYHPDSDSTGRLVDGEMWWQDSDHITQVSQLGADLICSNTSLYTAVVEAGHFAETGILSLSCLSSAIESNDIDKIPGKVVLVGTCGPDQINGSGLQDTLAKTLQDNKIMLDGKPDVLTLLAAMLHHHMLIYNTDITIMTGCDKTVLASPYPQDDDDAGHNDAVNAAHIRQVLALNP